MDIMVYPLELLNSHRQRYTGVGVHHEVIGALARMPQP